ncbi:two-component system sensor histidine kinase CreC [Thermomonas sp. HDW16]|uniref:two-component system sensor histidine kinase CreC n=1 Tax=Thermomonas sp. HDW16 TaxID=2714945 RepID=UPI00140D610D|nr:two-component system sensor histidine kinase CreC [Thermomonas sp. HDW16]QIL21779.1 two-component system sensor histidine kinase CreC [Thermomonas sp. HDW16]
MNIGLRVLLGYFLIVALAALLVTKVFVEQVKPGVRQAMEGTLIDTANTLAELATDDMLAGRIADGAFAQRVRAVQAREVGADISGFSKERSGFRVTVADARGIVVFDSEDRDVGRDNSRWNDVYRTLRGQYGARSTRSDPDDPDSTVMHVAAPIYGKDGDASGRIVGVLSVAKPNSAMAPFIARSQNIVARWGFVLMGVALLVGVMAAWWLSRQLGALRRYADAVTAGERAAQPAAAGEFGDLGRALHDMREKLEGKQYVEQYVHALTHELKSPLAAIRGAAELLEQPLPEADRQRFVASIAAQGERMAQMVDKLLALAAVEHRQRIEQPMRIDAFSLLHDAVQAVAQRAEAEGIEIMVDASPDAVLSGDAFLLRQALVNLLDNALDFAPRGSTVEVGASSVGDAIRFEVADHGAGVPDYARERVFERFYSLPRPDGGSRSSGLGLPFVAQVAELHGGRAELREREGGGTVAVLLLPA